MSTRLAVIADTHLADEASQDLDERVWEEIRRADLVLHAGDITGPALLERIAAVTPVVAVLGNNDRGLHHLPERWSDTIDGVRCSMIHDSGPRAGRGARLRRWFPHADLAVFGHSHEPVHELDATGLWLLNPGSPTQRRRQTTHSMAVATLDGGDVTVELIHFLASGRRSRRSP